MLKYPWQWVVMAIIAAADGIYFGKSDFETSSLVLVCLAVASIIANVRELH